MGNIKSTPYDDVFRTLLNDCTSLVLPVVNEIFGENYKGNECISFFQNEHFMNRQDADAKEKITDSCFIIHGTVDKKYHIECQSTPDGSMLVRMFEYDSQIALDSSVIANYVLSVSFPQSALLYLRHTLNTPDVMTIEIKTPGSNAIYQIPVMKIQRYTIDELFEKKLLFLIPFYIFCYEKQLPDYDADQKKLQEMEKEYVRIRERLDALCMAEELSEYEKCTIIDLSKKVLEHIAMQYDRVKERVINAMGGKILDYEAKDILNKGKIEICIGLIRDGLLSIAEAAKRLNMDESELKKYL